MLKTLHCLDTIMRVWESRVYYLSMILPPYLMSTPSNSLILVVVDFLKWRMSLGIFRKVTSHAVDVVFDQLGDILPRTLIVFETYPGH